MFKCITVILAFFLCSGCQTAKEISDPEQIIAKYIEAIGGKDGLQAIQALKITGLHIYRGVEFPITIFRMRPHYYRMEIDYGNQEQVMIFDGESFLEVGGQGAGRIRDPRHQHFLEMTLDLDGPLINYKSKGHDVVFAGTEDVDGLETYKLQVTLKNGEIEAWNFDPSTFLLIKRTATTKIEDRDFTHTLYFMDYQKVEGILFPHYIERLYPPHYVRGYEIHDVEVNPNLDTTLFKVAKTN